MSTQILPTLRLVDRLTGHDARIALDGHPTSYRQTSADCTFVMVELTDPEGVVGLYAIDTRDLLVVAA